MITRSDLEYLAAFEGGGEMVVSLYLDVSGKRYSPIQCAERTHQLVRDVSREMAADGLSAPALKGLNRSLDHIVRNVGAEADWGDAQSIALFCCEPRDLWKSFALHVPVADRIEVCPRPAIRPAVQILDEYPSCLVALIDQRFVRLLTAAQGELQARVEFEDDVDRRVKPSTYYGLQDKRIERHVDEQISAHLRHAAQEIDTLSRETGPIPIIIAGTNGLAKEFQGLLSPEAAGRVIAICHLPMEASASDILAVAMDETARAKKQQMEEIYVEARGRAFRGGAGALGLTDAFRALFAGAVDTLIIRGDRAVPGFECPNCARLFTGAPECPECGVRAGRLSKDILDDAVTCAIRQNARVRVQTGASFRIGEPSVAALLRFALPTVERLPLSA